MPTAYVEIRQSDTRSTSGSPDLPPICHELLFEQKTTVRELIRRTVEENVNAQLRQSRRSIQKDLAVVSQRSLTPQQIAAQAASGKIGMPSEVTMRRKLKRGQIDLDAQVRRAWKASILPDRRLTGSQKPQHEQCNVVGLRGATCEILHGAQDCGLQLF